MIDFSKAPEGATHYIEHDNDVVWVKNGIREYYKFIDGLWLPIIPLPGCVLKAIPKQPNMTIHCKTEREVMLCEQVLRMCRGEDSQVKSATSGEWIFNDAKDVTLFINYDYRSKPKKELVVPWELIDDKYTKLVVDINNESFIDVYGNHYDSVIKLDLTDIDLPVTVKRP